MTINEAAFADAIINLDSNVEQAQQYIKEKYNVESIYDKEKGTLTVLTNVNESKLTTAFAKEYLENQFDEDILTIAMY